MKIGAGLLYEIYERETTPPHFSGGFLFEVLVEDIVICIETLVMVGSANLQLKDADISIALPLDRGLTGSHFFYANPNAETNATVDLVLSVAANVRLTLKNLRGDAYLQVGGLHEICKALWITAFLMNAHRVRV